MDQSGESLDKIYKAKNFKKQSVIPGLNDSNSMDFNKKGYPSQD